MGIWQMQSLFSYFGSTVLLQSLQVLFFSSSSTRNISLQQSVTPWLLQDIADFRFIFISNINEQESIRGSSKNHCPKVGTSGVKVNLV